MRPYTFYFHDGINPLPTYEFFRCTGEADARARAQPLLERFIDYGLEIFDARTGGRALADQRGARPSHGWPTDSAEGHRAAERQCGLEIAIEEVSYAP